MQVITITMSGKGQFVLPKALRESLKLRPGCKVEVSIDSKGRLILTPALYEPEDLFRDRPPVKRVVSLEEMDQAIRKATRGRS
jgi:AbrB family looped-hinge helix DNA binding protein